MLFQSCAIYAMLLFYTIYSYATLSNNIARNIPLVTSDISIIFLYKKISQTNRENPNFHGPNLQRFSVF